MRPQHVWDFKGERISDQMQRDRRSLKDSLSTPKCFSKQRGQVMMMYYML